jgi:hypothetical protein
MTEQTHDKRLAELFWPVSGLLHHASGHDLSLPRYQVIDGKRVGCSMCGGSGNEGVPKQTGDG